jgi:hypothetical protein
MLVKGSCSPWHIDLSRPLAGADEGWNGKGHGDARHSMIMRDCEWLPERKARWVLSEIRYVIYSPESLFALMEARPKKDNTSHLFETLMTRYILPVLAVNHRQTC